MRIVLPAFLAIILFIISVFNFIIPAFKENIIDEKRTMIHELTNTVWSILNKYHNDAVKGTITIEEAQKKAVEQIEALRYGKDKKDYFWITDLRPVMIMHPYVHELNGKSLQDFTDPDGIKLFMEALKIAQTKNEGFISYRWQFKDDTSLIVPKLSFVKKFSPWNWIIGTGVYINDVQTEISTLTKNIIYISITIILIISLIIIFITHQSLKIERSRNLAEQQLHESREKYRSLIESSTEGIILLLNNTISYSNLYIQHWLGYSKEEIQNNPINYIFYNVPNINFDSITEETKLEIVLKKKNNTPTEAILTLLPVYFVDKHGLLFTFKDTNENRSIKNELEFIKTKLNIINNYSSIGMFRFSLQDKIILSECNQNLITLLGYNNETDLKKIPFSRIFANNSDIKTILKAISAKQIISNKTIQLRKKDGSILNAKITFIFNKDKTENFGFCDGIVETFPLAISQTENKLIPYSIISSVANALKSIDDIKQSPVSCPYHTPLASVIKIMVAHKSDFILLMNNAECMGSLSLKDIALRFFSSEYQTMIPAYQIMSSPVYYIHEKATVSEAFRLITENNISHVICKNHTGEITGVINEQIITSFFQDPQELIAVAIDNCTNITELFNLRAQIPKIIKPLVNETGSVHTLCKVISLYNDAITNKIIQIALKETGPAPVPFVFFTFGSSGREEFVFNSDQDNAIIFDTSETISIEELQNYFIGLSEKICKYLDSSGLALCKGNYMAVNKKWCQPLHIWKEYFAEWIINSDAANLLHISVFFDLRFVYGDQPMFKNIQDYISEILQGRSAFYFNLAQSIAGFKPPINVFGNIVTESSGKHPETLDIKNCLAPVIMLSRIYALHNGIQKTGTIDRINDLTNRNILSQATSEELLFHFNFLMQLRIRHQLEQIAENIEPDNLISPKKLSEIELVILKKIFSQMNGYQTKLSASFMNAFKN